jgi:hypothetical protein
MNISHQCYNLQQSLVLVIMNFPEGGHLRLKHFKSG